MMVRNISILRRELQEQYYHGLEQRYSSLHWMDILIQKLWQVLCDQCDHWNDILHQNQNLVTISEAVVITTNVQEELSI
jgi:hypothetical protein